MALGKIALFAVGVVTGAAVLQTLSLIGGSEKQAAVAADTESIDIEATQPPSIAAPVDQPATPLIDSATAELIRELTERVELAEFRIDELEAQIENIELQAPAAITPQPPQPEASSRQDLINAGLDPFAVDEIAAVRDDLQLQRLELRDLATREGWIDSDRFRQSLQELRADSRVKEILGEDDYDRLLLAEGRNNRVRIDSIINGSAADLAGVVIGDVIYRYGDERIFTFGDLRRATTSGERDQQVSLQVLRNAERIDLVVPRGPLGVTISGATQENLQ